MNRSVDDSSSHTPNHIRTINANTKNRLEKDLRKFRHGSTIEEGMDELGLELSSLGPGSQTSQGYAMSSVAAASATARELKAAEEGEASASASASLRLGLESDGESAGVEAGRTAGAWEGGRQRQQQSQYDHDGNAGSSGSSSDGDDEEDDTPFTYEQLQERTQAARAAVNILLPNRTDTMAEREGLRRRRGRR